MKRRKIESHMGKVEFGVFVLVALLFVGVWWMGDPSITGAVILEGGDTGVWIPVEDEAYEGGLAQFSNTNESSLTFEFNDTNVVLVTQLRNDFGIVDILIDEIYDHSIDLYDGSTTYGVEYTVVNGSDGEWHNLTFVVSGNKNPESGNTYIVVDAVIDGDNVSGPPPPPPALEGDGPAWSNARDNFTSIYAGETGLFEVDWEDNDGLESFIFSTDDSGSWVNQSVVDFSGTINTSSFEYEITSSGGTVHWLIYANNTNSSWNVTGEQSFSVLEDDPFSVQGTCNSCSTCQTQTGTIDSTVTLTSDITDVSAVCITVQATGVTIDCDGFTITGDTAYNAIETSKENTTVRNCAFEGVGTAIYFDGIASANNMNFTNNNISSGNAGIDVSAPANNVLIQNNVINVTNSGSKKAITVGNNFGSGSGIIRNNNITDADYGIYLLKPNNYNVTGNIVFDSTTNDIYAAAGTLNYILNNSFYGPGSVDTAGTGSTNIWCYDENLGANAWHGNSYNSSTRAVLDCGPAANGTITVNQTAVETIVFGSSATYPAIEQGLNNVPPGGTVTVADNTGLYHENFTLTNAVYHSDITLNCQYNAWNGTDKQTAITSSSANRNVIQNCNFTDFGIAIDLANSYNWNITNSTFNNHSTAINIDGISDGNLVFRNNFFNSTTHVADGGGNFYNTSDTGNFWDDYTAAEGCTDTNPIDDLCDRQPYDNSVGGVGAGVSDNFSKFTAYAFETGVASDASEPAWNGPSVNFSTINYNQAGNFSVNWTDDTALSTYIFSTNDTGIWVNKTAVAFSGTSALSDYEYTLTSDDNRKKSEL